MNNNGHRNKEVFSTSVNIAGLSYATTTEVYKNGILTTMLTYGHVDTGQEGHARLGNEFKVSLYNQDGICPGEFAKLQQEKLAEVLKKSLPSS